jgi:auxin influx carrier (AUX1 LAX family)
MQLCVISNIYYINDKYDKRTWTYIFGACCATTVFIPSFHNYRIWSFLGLLMTTYTAWYLTIAAVTHGQVSIHYYRSPFLTSLSFHSTSLEHRSLIERRTTLLQVEGATHSGPAKMVLYFTGATNILYTFGGHAVTV